MQRETVLEQALSLLEQQGFGAATLETLANRLQIAPDVLRDYWPNREALLYDSLRHHAQQVDAWRRHVQLDDHLTIEQKLLTRYQVLREAVQHQRYPGCLFIAACYFFPDPEHPIHSIAEQQKQASLHYTKALLDELDIEDTDMVALQMELILEGCLSKLLVKRQISDIEVARRLAEDVLRMALCRKNGALT
ncbi:division control transcriptional repressor DicD [Musicola paradisiaca]|uniref:Transcriptional regulator, TetR family n=1 Tax=Musicola paradisiaca (strain Ech703) TaxID=579405 RepID=C6C375_MUSP7|nr:transcriptional regulator [Musicola paradisiaca]ACS87173.1 transcriptional regulator, TetR family [Musicola paradisiaca Ech703]